MAAPGRKPKNVALKVIEGNPGGRPLPELPDLAKLGAEPPEWLNDLAKRIWMRWAASLIENGLFFDVHQELLASACLWWARFEEYNEIVEEVGATGEDGKRRGVAIACEAAFNSAIKAMRELGLTPSEMARMMKASAKGGGKAEMYGF